MSKHLCLIATLCTLVSASAVAQNEATIQQVGQNHVVSLAQWSAAQSLGSQALIRQENGLGADGHSVLLEQTGGAFADIFQTGSGNGLFGVGALGVGSEDEAARSFGGSTLLLSQSGIQNLAFVDQAGGAYASITQSGVGNMVTIIQQ